MEGSTYENENKYLKKYGIARSLLFAKYMEMGAISMAWLTKNTHTILGVY